MIRRSYPFRRVSYELNHIIVGSWVVKENHSARFQCSEIIWDEHDSICLTLPVTSYIEPGGDLFWSEISRSTDGIDCNRLLKGSASFCSGWMHAGRKDLKPMFLQKTWWAKWSGQRLSCLELTSRMSAIHNLEERYSVGRSIQTIRYQTSCSEEQAASSQIMLSFSIGTLTLVIHQGIWRPRCPVQTSVRTDFTTYGSRAPSPVTNWTNQARQVSTQTLLADLLYWQCLWSHLTRLANCLSSVDSQCSASIPWTPHDVHSCMFWLFGFCHLLLADGINLLQVSKDPVVVLLPKRKGEQEWDFNEPAEWDSHRLIADPDHVFVAAPFLIFDSSDLWHGAVQWDDADRFGSSVPKAARARESVELRFRCRCDPSKHETCQLSPITEAYRTSNISDNSHRVAAAVYNLKQ